MTENGSVSSVENVCCMNVVKPSHITLIYDVQRAHPIHTFLFLTKINYQLIVNFPKKVNYYNIFNLYQPLCKD